MYQGSPGMTTTCPLSVHTPRYVQSLLARLSRSGERGRCWESSGVLRLLVGERQAPLGERLTEQP